MDKRERVQAAFQRQPVDRVPIALWRHFPEDDQTAAGLCRVVATFQRRYDFDFVKVTPTADYLAIEWGVQSEYRGSKEGTRDVTARPIATMADWAKLRVLDAGSGSLGRQLESLRLLRTELAGDVPILQTIFSPLSTARKVGGDLWLESLRNQPATLHTVLAIIAATTARFAQESLRAGVDGIFFANQMSSRTLLSDEEHRDFGEQYDRQVLDAVVAARDWNVLHLHGENVRFELAAQYPVAAVNWHDRLTAPSLHDALGLFTGGLIGGLDEHGVLLHGNASEVGAEIADAVAQTGGRGLVVGAGCVIRIDTPNENIKAAVTALRR